MSKMSRALAVFMGLGVSIAIGAGCGAAGPASQQVAPTPGVASAPLKSEEPLADPATWEKWKNADYAILAPRRFADALAPLARHREKGGHTVAMLDADAIFERRSHGKPDASAAQAALKQPARHTSGKLKFV